MASIIASSSSMSISIESMAATETVGVWDAAIAFLYRPKKPYISEWLLKTAITVSI